MYSTEQKYTNVILVRVDKDKEETGVFDELTDLAHTAGYLTVGTLTQRREKPDHTFYIGTGKVQELAEAIKALDAEKIIFDNEVSPSQLNNLEKELKIPVIDRATLILEIFEYQVYCQSYLSRISQIYIFGKKTNIKTE